MSKIVREGDLYRAVHVFGRTFELRYGYYAEYERHSKYNEPIPIYPNFTEHPQYTDDGYPFATEMQRACGHYVGDPEESICFECEHFQRGEELFGLCICTERRRQTDSSV